MEMNPNANVPLSDLDLDQISGGVPFLLVLAATLAADFIIEAALDDTPKAHAPTLKDKPKK